MKIEITETMKRILTISEMPAVKAMQAEFKAEKFQWEADKAAYIASGASCKVLSVSAEIAKNCRIRNYYGNGNENSGDLDIWLHVLAYDRYCGFYDIGAYLSDIWSSNGDNTDEIRSHMFVLAFTERKQ